MKKICFLAILIVLFLLPGKNVSAASVASIDLGDGSVIISENGYTQNNQFKETNTTSYIIRGSLPNKDVDSINDTVIKTEGNAIFDITLKDVSINAEYISNDLFILNNLSTLKLQGKNTINVRYFDTNISVFNLSYSSLTISGGGSLSVNMYGSDGYGMVISGSGESLIIDNIDFNFDIGGILIEASNLTLKRLVAKSSRLNQLAKSDNITIEDVDLNISNQLSGLPLIEATDIIIDKSNFILVNTNGLRGSESLISDSEIKYTSSNSFNETDSFTSENTKYIFNTNKTPLVGNIASITGGSIKSSNTILAIVEEFTSSIDINAVVLLNNVYTVYGQVTISDIYYWSQLEITEGSELINEGVLSIEVLVNDGLLTNNGILNYDEYDSTLDFTQEITINGVTYNPLIENITTESFSWNCLAMELTLHGINITTLDNSFILFPGTKVVIKEGTNNNVTSINGNAFYSGGSIFFKGTLDGTLTIRGNNVGINSKFVSFESVNINSYVPLLIDMNVGIEFLAENYKELSFYSLESNVALYGSKLVSLYDGLIVKSFIDLFDYDCSLEFRRLEIEDSIITSEKTNGIIRVNDLVMNNSAVDFTDFGDALIIASNANIYSTKMYGSTINYVLDISNEGIFNKLTIDSDNLYGGIRVGLISAINSKFILRNTYKGNIKGLIVCDDAVLDVCTINLYSYCISSIYGNSIEFIDCELYIDNYIYYGVLATNSIVFNKENVGSINAPLSTLYVIDGSITINDVREIYNNSQIFDNKYIGKTEANIIEGSEFDYIFTDSIFIYLGSNNLYFVHNEAGELVMTFYYSGAPIIPPVKPGYKFEGWIDSDGNFVDFSIQTEECISIYPKFSIIDSSTTTNGPDFPYKPITTPRGVVIGITIGCVAFLLIIGVSMFFYGYRMHHPKNNE